MDLTPYISSLREDLTATAAAGDEHTRKAAETLSGALEPAMRLTLMTALSDLAAEVSAQLEHHEVDVRLRGRDVRVVVSPSGPPQAGAAPNSAPFSEGTQQGDISRMTLRLLDQLKSKAEDAAAAQGVSLNTYVSQALQSALQGTGPWTPYRPHNRQEGEQHQQEGEPD
ncbi:toxin-antitoxin system HicB family antitoxin [Haloechinothrix sp. LS1_15]|uniref:toxin-antitoxin system HicB family antitoxin n=1 Tax=Haloechinothrix sp. LS1_15 TaxID=2652248 RepID=UPI002947E4B0|nr:toxin-antitoxin system HicB family antitoxin [Haloechinothrix sp. LS1_15]MDV6012153.1 toxin-antitoxin system HicB family antitoxin [Haloechinothrix sp. LS1_15]